MAGQRPAEGLAAARSFANIGRGRPTLLQNGRSLLTEARIRANPGKHRRRILIHVNEAAR